jgi:hypothetical protein
MREKYCWPVADNPSERGVIVASRNPNAIIARAASAATRYDSDGGEVGGGMATVRLHQMAATAGGKVRSLRIVVPPSAAEFLRAGLL